MKHPFGFSQAAGQVTGRKFSEVVKLCKGFSIKAEGPREAIVRARSILDTLLELEQLVQLVLRKRTSAFSKKHFSLQLLLRLRCRMKA